MITHVRSLSYPGADTSPEPYDCTAEMLRFKAEVVMADTQGMTGWPLAYRRRVANALTTKAWTKEVEGNNG